VFYAGPPEAAFIAIESGPPWYGRTEPISLTALPGSYQGSSRSFQPNVP